MNEVYVLRDKKAVKVDGLDQYEGTASVAVTEVAPGVAVSTVFLGIDHRHFGNGPPILFETMVFNDYGDDGTQERYSTWEEAEAGHARIVAEQKERIAV